MKRYNCVVLAMKEDKDGKFVLYADIKKDLELLEALRAAGVRNWDGWDEAIEMLQSEQEEKVVTELKK